ncbi:hypothetical protein OSCT_1104 [Oscillochloris trichoides DG-6]|uniref:Uncharacterized protein n=1 Tax=Oscillochloris trichoides DG-6 TaxID=765420 RepID=E1ICQ3_9CHLR|nr:hypothetical protein OSCT_1104 [Oscillochloris trichoides DG-6]
MYWLTEAVAAEVAGVLLAAPSVGVVEPPRATPGLVEPPGPPELPGPLPPEPLRLEPLPPGLLLPGLLLPEPDAEYAPLEPLPPGEPLPLVVAHQSVEPPSTTPVAEPSLGLQPPLAVSPPGSRWYRN